MFCSDVCIPIYGVNPSKMTPPLSLEQIGIYEDI